MGEIEREKREGEWDRESNAQTCRLHGLLTPFVPCGTLQLAHPILGALRDTDKQWLIDLLYAFNSGTTCMFMFLCILCACVSSVCTAMLLSLMTITLAHSYLQEIFVNFSHFRVTGRHR